MKGEVNVSVTLKLADRDAALVAEALFKHAQMEEDGESKVRFSLKPRFGSATVKELLRLSAAFETAVQANQRK